MAEIFFRKIKKQETLRLYKLLQWPVAIGLATTMLSSCSAKEQVVTFQDLGPYMQVSLEKNSLIFRAIPSPDSYAVITQYNFFREGNKCVLILMKESGNKRPTKNIQYNEGGLVVTVPVDDLNFEEAVFIYKDLDGEHQINKGSSKDWLDYIKGVKAGVK